MLFWCSKLIGARYYGFELARDTLGHVSHTVSMAAGENVNSERRRAICMQELPLTKCAASSAIRRPYWPDSIMPSLMAVIWYRFLWCHKILKNWQRILLRLKPFTRRREAFWLCGLPGTMSRIEGRRRASPQGSLHLLRASGYHQPSIYRRWSGNIYICIYILFESKRVNSFGLKANNSLSLVYGQAVSRNCSKIVAD